MNVKIRPFGADDLGFAARLLADRHALHRAAEPLLSDADAGQAVERTWNQDGTSGAVALRDDVAVGFLFGTVRETSLWPRHAWIGHAAHAAADPEVLRDLYAVAARA